MLARVLIDGRSYDIQDLEAVLTVMLPNKYPELWDLYFTKWRTLDRKRQRHA